MQNRNHRRQVSALPTTFTKPFRVQEDAQICPCSQEFVQTVHTVTIRVPEITPRVYGLPGLYEFLKPRARFVGRFVHGLYGLYDFFKRRAKLSTSRPRDCTHRPTNRARRLRNSYKPGNPYTRGVISGTLIVTVCTVSTKSLRKWSHLEHGQHMTNDTELTFDGLAQLSEWRRQGYLSEEEFHKVKQAFG